MASTKAINPTQYKRTKFPKKKKKKEDSNKNKGKEDNFITHIYLINTISILLSIINQDRPEGIL